MPKKKKAKSYYAGSVEEAYHANGTFVKGDRVKVRSCDPAKWPEHFGNIISLVHGNFGQGRVYAEVFCDDGKVRREPLGRLRKV